MGTKCGLPRKCEHCVYACPMKDGPRTLLICANTPDAPGRIVRIDPADVCAHFTTGRRRVSVPRARVRRIEPPQPPCDEIRYIPLTRGKFAIVDTTDYETLAQYHWHAVGNERDGFYAARWLPGRKLLLMHREIMAPPKGMVVDHIDGNRANNRRINLRICTLAENNRNAAPSRNSTSRFKGVHWDKKSGRWVAAIYHNGRQMYLGSFDDEIEAAKAYDRKAREFFGEFARLNFPEEK